MIRLLICISTLFLLTHTIALAQEDANSATGEPSFEEVFSEWKSLFKDLRDLQVRFSIAEESDLAITAIGD